MYSRDIFPRYTGGGMPIPENYSGNALRRPRTGAEDAPGERTRVHVPNGQGMPSAAHRERQERPRAVEREAEAVPQESAAVDADMAEVPEASAPSDEAQAARDGGEAVAIEEKKAAMPSFLSALLPPKPSGGGLLSEIGVEELLLLGLFLLLSQGETEDDTLMLLALLFLYK